mmetsp:Transcript_27297/g.70827  ORF Transcript_27297/g.70827 Transcript_27297/m.70827 type:complete len:261 (-) Transcript_27297:179-961(-)
MLTSLVFALPQSSNLVAELLGGGDDTLPSRYDTPANLNSKSDRPANQRLDRLDCWIQGVSTQFVVSRCREEQDRTASRHAGQGGFREGVQIRHPDEHPRTENTNDRHADNKKQAIGNHRFHLLRTFRDLFQNGRHVQSHKNATNIQRQLRQCTKRLPELVIVDHVQGAATHEDGESQSTQRLNHRYDDARERLADAAVCPNQYMFEILAHDAEQNHVPKHPDANPEPPRNHPPDAVYDTSLHAFEASINHPQRLANRVQQ